MPDTTREALSLAKRVLDSVRIDILLRDGMPTKLFNDADAAIDAALSAPAAAPAPAEVPSDELAALLDMFCRASQEFGILFDRHQGKGWPDESAERHRVLRDERLPDLKRRIAALAAAPVSAVPAEATSSIDHAQRVGYLGTPDEWRERCRLFRARCNEDDIAAMAKMRAYIEEGLLVVVRPSAVAAAPAAPVPQPPSEPCPMCRGVGSHGEPPTPCQWCKTHALAASLLCAMPLPVQRWVMPNEETTR